MTGRRNKDPLVQEQHQVIVVGGGPVGMALAISLGSRGIRCVLADPPGSSLYAYFRRGALAATGSG